MSCVNGSCREVLRGIVRSSQGLVVCCKEAGIMVAQGMLLSQVVVLLVNACHVLCLHPRMRQVLRWWQHFLPHHSHCQRAACPIPEQGLRA